MPDAPGPALAASKGGTSPAGSAATQAALRRGDELNDDPLHGFLVGLRLFAEMVADLPSAHPGCLAASFAYQDQLFNQEIRALNAEGLLAWRHRFRERLDLIAERYPPRIEVDFEALADMAGTLIEGGIVLGRALQDGSILPRQIILYRELIRSTFAPALSAA